MRQLILYLSNPLKEESQWLFYTDRMPDTVLFALYLHTLSHLLLTALEKVFLSHFYQWGNSLRGLKSLPKIIQLVNSGNWVQVGLIPDDVQFSTLSWIKCITYTYSLAVVSRDVLWGSDYSMRDEPPNIIHFSLMTCYGSFFLCILQKHSYLFLIG